VFLEGFERSVASHLSDADVRALQAALGKVLEANGKPATIACHPDAGTASGSASSSTDAVPARA
jgi:hypothetical protein